MYYRRKLLLALVEVFGGELSNVDCQKLMFLFCQRTHHNHYDFFPYKFGACSFVLHQDKIHLVNLGHLEDVEGFQIQAGQQYAAQLDVFAQVELQELVQEIGSLRGDDLIKKSYLEYPYYASRSQIASKILEKKDYKKVQKTQNRDCDPYLFTIGYEGLTIDSYLNILLFNNVSILVDVRKNPISRKYGFSKNQLKKYVENIGIDYAHLPELGVPSNMRQHLDSAQAYGNLFRHYAENILPEQSATLTELKNLIHEKKRVALTCFEAAYTCCHRSKITEYFEHDPSFNIPIQHLQGC